MWTGKNGGLTIAARMSFKASPLLGGTVDVEDAPGSRMGEKNGRPSTWS